MKSFVGVFVPARYDIARRGQESIDSSRDAAFLVLFRLVELSAFLGERWVSPLVAAQRSSRFFLKSSLISSVRGVRCARLRAPKRRSRSCCGAFIAKRLWSPAWLAGEGFHWRLLCGGGTQMKLTLSVGYGIGVLLQIQGQAQDGPLTAARISRGCRFPPQVSVSRPA